MPAVVLLVGIPAQKHELRPVTPPSPSLSSIKVGAQKSPRCV